MHCPRLLSLVFADRPLPSCGRRVVSLVSLSLPVCCRELRGGLLSRQKLWPIGCGADHLSLHALHVSPMSGCHCGSCGTLSMTQSPGAPVKCSVFLRWLRIDVNI